MRPKKEQFSVETIIVFLKANRGFSCAVLKIYDCWFFFRVFFFSRPNSRTRRRKGRRSTAGCPHSVKATVSDTELESLNDTKSPIAASLAGGKPYFMSLDSYREAMADDPNANPVDRHNSKERHRR